MITSSQNPLVRQVRALLKSRREREAASLFVVEGIQGVVAAIQSEAPLHALLWSPERLSSELARQAIEQARARGVRVEAVSAELFAALSQRDNPAGLLAVAERRLTPLEALPVGPTSLFVALDRIGDPGNLGTILRSADATGVTALLLLGPTVDPFHPTTVKASAGTLFSVPLVPVEGDEALLAWAARHRLPLIATSDQAAEGYWSCPYLSPMILLMGSEAHGLPDALLAAATRQVRIPMAGQADSLNLGVATSLMLYEIRRQQRA